MNEIKRFISIKTKIMFSMLIPVIISFLLICSIIFASLFNSLQETAKAEFLQIGQKYANGFESKIKAATDYLAIVSSSFELRVATGFTDREMARDTVLNAFNCYNLVDGSSVYFEPDMYDGKDAEYINSEFGTESSGRICYYFYKDNGETVYLPEALENDIEFDLPHYTEAKKLNKPIYTEPTVFEVEGREIPMFTITYPINNTDGEFIGAVTVDLFLEDIYTQLQNEKIYKTGYIVIVNDKNQVIYSPKFEDIGKTRYEAKLHYALPLGNEETVFFNANSIINDKKTLIAIKSIYIPQLNSFFYISVAAPTEEINESGTRLITILAAFSILIIIAIALLLFYLINRITSPIKEITESADKIAYGNLDTRSAFVLPDTKIIDEVFILSASIKKMLSQIDEVQDLKLESLKLKYEKDKAESAAQAKSDFLAKMSHEIRTPMNAVMGMSELILRKNLPPDVYENARMIKSASSNLLSIINDVLDFSKIESGKMEIVESDYLLPSLVNDIISIIRIRLADKPILFTVSVEPGIPSSLKGDEARIRQVLINLLSNAVKYTREGTISFTVTSEINGDNIILTFCITDSGIGIKEEDINKLFGDFVQIDAEKNKGIEGTGLGLAISRNLCLIMGGDIAVRSEYGKGSEFIITLPQKIIPGKPFASVDNPDEKSVLIYETRADYRDSVEEALRSLGVPFKRIDNIPSLFENMGKYEFVFVSSFMYGSINPTLAKSEKPPKLVLLADISETLAPKDARMLTLPAHSLSIANILNDEYEDYNGVQVLDASFIAPEASILIVDDITANLKVCEGLLLPYEAQVTLCNSGREAIRLVTENRYDLVFMDHMMPEMDGLEVTKHIRDMDDVFFKNLPIVALTANAVSGMKEMFIQNGMNDFLAKPIETAKLDAILNKWIPKEKRIKSNKTQQTEESNEFVDMLRGVSDLSVQKALLVVGGSKKTYERIVRLSIRTLPENIAKLDILLESNLPNYAIEVHGVKGVLNNMGAYEHGKAALELEELSKKGDLEACKRLHPIFISKLEEFSDSLIALTEKAEKPEKTDGDLSQLNAFLPELREAADFFDSAHALEVISTFCNYSYGQESDKVLADITDAFERFDFDLAIQLIDSLVKELNTDE